MIVLIGGLGAKHARTLQATRRALRAQGYIIQEAENPEAYIEGLKTQPRPDIALINAPGDEWMQVLRSSKIHIYIIGLYPRLSAKRYLAAWNAGMDDVTLLSATPEEISGRVGALSRIRDWVPTLSDDFAQAHFQPEEYAAIRGLDALLCASLNDMLGVKLEIEELGEEAPLPVLACGAEMPLMLVDEHTEMAIGIGVTAEETRPMLELLFGDADETDLILDSIMELSNICGGALKRKVLEEGKTFSMGLPRDTPKPAAPLHKSWSLICDDLELIAWVRVTVKLPSRLCVDSLSEGMVLSKPIYNKNGLMLLPDGAVLTERTIVRLGRWLGGNALIEVTCAA